MDTDNETKDAADPQQKLRDRLRAAALAACLRVLHEAGEVAEFSYSRACPGHNPPDLKEAGYERLSVEVYLLKKVRR